MSNKSPRIAALIERHRGQRLPAHYLAYFDCFNQRLYYEAHDVLEELWLSVRQGPKDGFYKGLIQFAGAFVHLQKNRLRPAAALFKLSQSYLSQYPSPHEGLDVTHVLEIASAWIVLLEEASFSRNPMEHETPPVLSVVDA
jgi:predicted metal-dependent hydrolase